MGVQEHCGQRALRCSRRCWPLLSTATADADAAASGAGLFSLLPPLMLMLQLAVLASSSLCNRKC